VSEKPPPSLEQLVVAVSAFLAAMARSYYARHPGAEDCRVPNWETTSTADRAVLIQAMRAALIAANDETAIQRFRENANSLKREDS
jgi:hypothetical protein